MKPSSKVPSRKVTITCSAPTLCLFHIVPHVICYKKSSQFSKPNNVTCLFLSRHILFPTFFLQYQLCLLSYSTSKYKVHCGHLCHVGCFTEYVLMLQSEFLKDFISTGTLLRRLEGGLRGISHVVVDEIHERDINVSLFKHMTYTPVMY